MHLETRPLSYQTKWKCFIPLYSLRAASTWGGPACREFSPAVILLPLSSFLGQRWGVWDPNRSIKDGFELPHHHHYCINIQTICTAKHASTKAYPFPPVFNKKLKAFAFTNGEGKVSVQGCSEKSPWIDFPSPSVRNEYNWMLTVIWLKEFGHLKMYLKNVNRQKDGILREIFKRKWFN